MVLPPTVLQFAQRKYLRQQKVIPPQGHKFFFSSSLIKKYVKNETMLYCLIVYELVRSEKNIYKKKIIVPMSSTPPKKSAINCKFVRVQSFIATWRTKVNILLKLVDKYSPSKQSKIQFRIVLCLKNSATSYFNDAIFYH